MINFLELMMKKSFCLHGGIPRELVSLQQVNAIVDIGSKMVEQLLWGDPSKFGTSSSSGLRTWLCFGVQIVDHCYECTKMSCIVKGREYASSGITMNERLSLTTVYSAGASTKTVQEMQEY